MTLTNQSIKARVLLSFVSILTLVTPPISAKPKPSQTSYKQITQSLVGQIIEKQKEYLFPAPPSYDLTLTDQRIQGQGCNFDRLALSAMGIKNNQKFTDLLVMEQRERDELRLKEMVVKQERALTSFGFTSLMQQLPPSIDITELKKRQDIIRLLVDDASLCDGIADLLKKIHSNELEMLSYWVPKIPLHSADKDFHWHLWFADSVKPIGFINKYLNTNMNTLAFGAALTSLWPINAFFLSVTGDDLVEKILKAATLGATEDIVPNQLFLKKIQRLIRSHNPLLSQFDPQAYRKAVNNDDSRVYKTMINTVLDHGSFGDEWTLRNIGVKSDSSTDTKRIKWGIPYIWDDLINMPISNIIPFASDYTSRIHMDDTDIPLLTKLVHSIIIPFWVIYADYKFISSIKSSVASVRNTSASITALHQHLKNIKSLLNDAEHLGSLIKDKNNLLAMRYKQSLNIKNNPKNSPEFKEFLKELATTTFDQECSTWLYSRGRVLRVHDLLKKTKNELSACLRAIGEIDAFLSIATMIKSSANSTTPWTFVEFEQSEKPLAIFNNCWCPLITSNEIVSNDLDFGADDSANKILLTGPNGGGKSAIIKSLGISAFCAQSWGVVPASYGRMTPFDELATCFHSSENIMEGNSTFMAGKKDMLHVTERVQKSVANNKKMLLLVDEPYLGTIDGITGRRVHAFGQQVASMPSVMAIIATHTEKPTLLENETKGIFANYHIGITHGERGFALTYKLQRGLCEWWLHDENKQDNFVDWLTPINAKPILVKNNAAHAQS